MERDELLKEFKKENEDEGIAYMENISTEYGFKAMLLLTIILMIYQIIKNQPYENTASIMFSFLAFSHLRKYKYTGERKDQIIGILYLLYCLICLVFYVVKIW